jgi:hypothetical protein
MPVTGGEISRVHHVYIAKFLGGYTGVLVAGGKVCTDADVNQCVTGGEKPLEQGAVVRDVVCRSGAKAAASCNVIKNICWGDVCAVPISLFAHNGIKPLELHLMLLQPLWREVTGTVGGDTNVHRKMPP